MKSLIFSSLLLSSLTAYAGGDKVGGGGDVVICPKSPVKVRLLDSVEAAQAESGRIPLTMNLGGKNATLRQKIDLMHDRLAAVDGNRADEYRAEVLKIWADLQAAKNGTKSPYGLATRWGRLPDVDDENENFVLPVGCTKEQLVKQDAPMDDQDWTYRFVGEYLDLLDRDELVATLYHEAIYKEFRGAEHRHSQYVRRLNAWMFSGKISELPTGQYLDFLGRSGLANVDLFGRIRTVLPAIQCDAEKNVVKVNQGRVEILPGIEVDATDIRFKEGGALQSLNAKVVAMTAFARGGKILPTMNPPYPPEGGQAGSFLVEFLGDGNLALKSSALILEVSAEGRIIRKLSPLTFADQITAEDRAALEKVVGCVAAGSPTKKTYVPAKILEEILMKAMGQARAHNLAALEATLTDCKKTVHENRRAKASRSEADAAAELSFLNSQFSGRDGHVHRFLLSITGGVTPQICDVEGPAVGAALFFGNEIGYIKARCVMNNGEIRRYVGPRLHLFTLGVGAHISYDHYRTAPSTNTSVSASRSLFVEGESGDITRFGFGRIRFDSGLENEKPKKAGYGAYVGLVDIGANFGIRLGNRHEHDYSRIMFDLLAGDTDELLEN